MYTYKWLANGDIVNLNKCSCVDYEINEHFEESNSFSINKNELCLNETCINTEDLIKLKKQILNYSIVDDINNKDILTNFEIREYFKQIFVLISNTNNDEDEDEDEDFEDNRLDIIKKYFIYNFYDERTGDIFSHPEIYDEFEFLNYYSYLDNSSIGYYLLDKDNILEIEKNKNYSYFNLDNNPDYEIITINPRIYYIYLEEFDIYFELIKVTKLMNNENIESIWIILTENEDDRLMFKIQNIFSNEFNELYKENLDYIEKFDNYHSNNDLIKSRNITYLDLINYFDSYKKISISNGIFDFNAFKDNLFIKIYFGNIINLNMVTEKFFNEVITPNNTDNINLNEFNNTEYLKQEFNDKKNEIELNLGENIKVNNIYYLISKTINEFIYLIQVKLNTVSNYKWQILFLNQEI